MAWHGMAWAQPPSSSLAWSEVTKLYVNPEQKKSFAARIQEIKEIAAPCASTPALAHGMSCTCMASRPIATASDKALGAAWDRQGCHSR